MTVVDFEPVEPSADEFLDALSAELDLAEAAGMDCAFQRWVVEAHRRVLAGEFVLAPLMPRRASA